MNRKERRAMTILCCALMRAIDHNIGGEEGRRINPTFASLYDATEQMLAALDGGAGMGEAR